MKLIVRFVEYADLPALAYGLDFPTEGQFAADLWQLLSSGVGRLPFQYAEAAQMYRDCGYIPFSGYPLARSGRITLAQEEKANAVLA